MPVVVLLVACLNLADLLLARGHVRRQELAVRSALVSRRTREFGIRIAIGAHPRALLWQVLREGGRITAIGIGIGLLLALGAGQFLKGILYGVKSFEPVVLVTAPLILLVASLLASYIPALRATRIDPTVALRSE
jgi:ABC-type antimicrobial peptide transport system permease subunit